MNKTKVYGKSFILKNETLLLGKLILESNLHIQDCSQITKENMFLWDVLAGWCKINNSESTHVITKEVIWNNFHIKCYNKILFYHDWYEKGIKLIEHIYDFRIKMILYIRTTAKFV